jgi:hypothetical protein
MELIVECEFECEFEYEISGKVDSGKTISRSGRMKIGREMEDMEDYAEPEMLYSEAVQAAIRDFWYFELSEHGGSYTFPTDFTVSIRNLTDVTDYGDEE